MLISFSVRNFRTFRDKVEWSLIASPDKTREEDNVIEVPAFGLRLLKSAVVYGANASGKSKLIEALQYMNRFVSISSKGGQIGDSTGAVPFALNPSSAVMSSEFEIQFLYQKELYRYGFEVSSLRVESEWLFVRSEKKIRSKPEVELFYRDGQNISFNSKLFGGIVGELVKNTAVRENALLLSVAAQFNQPRAVDILKWFYLVFYVSGGENMEESALTFMTLRYPSIKEKIVSFLVDSDVDIDSIKEGEQSAFDFKSVVDSSDTAKRLQQWANKEYSDVKTLHKAYDDNRELVSAVAFSLLEDESIGTRKLLAIAGPVISTLEIGGVLVVDELDARLHPNLVNRIVRLFNSKETNPNNAQLLFNTHDTNLLTSGNFRRDQIWFTEKNRYGEATLYSLADFKTDVVRKGDNLEANYVRGKYGAVPYLGDFNALPKTNADAEPKPQASHE